MTRQIVSVLGAGSWGTALAHLAVGRGHAVRLWTRHPEAARRLTSDGQNLKYLPGVSLEQIGVNSHLGEVLEGADWVIAAVPCAGVVDLAREAAPLMSPQAKVISGSKGLNAETGQRASQMWESAAGLSAARFVALSGPNLAREIIGGVPTSTVVASLDGETATLAQQLLNSRVFRVYTNTDLIGVELGGALKNVVAIAAGICDGLDFGDNAKAALMTRHWREMTRLAQTLGAQESTFFGLSGIGDLFATCVSVHSRNHSLGFKLGRGESLPQAQREVAQVAEGVHTTRAAIGLAQAKGLELPVTEQLSAILFESRDVRRAVEELMCRQGCAE